VSLLLLQELQVTPLSGGFETDSVRVALNRRTRFTSPEPVSLWRLGV
jgi:hypothetical protein